MLLAGSPERATRVTTRFRGWERKQGGVAFRWILHNPQSIMPGVPPLQTLVAGDQALSHTTKATTPGVDGLLRCLEPAGDLRYGVRLRFLDHRHHPFLGEPRPIISTAFPKPVDSSCQWSDKQGSAPSDKRRRPSNPAMNAASSSRTEEESNGSRLGVSAIGGLASARLALGCRLRAKRSPHGGLRRRKRPAWHAGLENAGEAIPYKSSPVLPICAEGQTQELGQKMRAYARSGFVP